MSGAEFQKQMAADPLLALERLAASDRLPFFRRGLRRIYLVTDPADIEQVLAGHSDQYEKTRKRSFLGEGIVGSRGKQWERQRAAGAAALRGPRPAPLDHFIDELTDKWAGESRKAIATLSDLSLLNLRYVVVSLFGLELGNKLQTVSRAIEVLVGREPSALRLALLGDRSEYGRSLRALKAIGEEMAAQVRASGGATFFTRALLAERGGAPLADELINYLLAAGETTTMALAWTLQCLAWNQLAQRLARRSLVEQRPEYLRAVVKESLRLYPPVWAIARRARAADTLAGKRVKKGDEILVVPYLTHRSARHWRDPGSFRPERFLVDKRPAAYSYLPFGAGGRSCLGAQFALEEMEKVVGSLLLRFRLSPGAAAPVRPLPLFTLRPASSAPLRLRELPGRLLPYKELARRVPLGENLGKPLSSTDLR